MAAINISSLKDSLGKVRTFDKEGNSLAAKFNGAIERAERQIDSNKTARLAAEGNILARQIWQTAQTGDFTEAIRLLREDRVTEGALSIYFISAAGRAINDAGNADFGQSQVSKFSKFLEHAQAGLEMLQKFSAAVDSEEPAAILDSLGLSTDFNVTESLPASAQSCAVAYVMVTTTTDMWSHELRAQGCRQIAKIAGQAAVVLRRMNKAGMHSVGGVSSMRS